MIDQDFEALTEAIRDNDLSALQVAAKSASYTTRERAASAAARQGSLPAVSILAPTLSADTLANGALVAAIEHGHREVSSHILGILAQNPGDLSILLENAFESAALKGDTQTVSAIFDLPMSEDGRSRISGPSLHKAASRGDMAMLALILERAKPFTESIHSAIHSAILTQKKEPVLALLPHADTEKLGLGALPLAAEKGDSAIFEAVFQATPGAAKGRKYALVAAAQKGHPDIVKKLIPFADREAANHALQEALSAHRKDTTDILADHLGSAMSRMTTELGLAAAVDMNNLSSARRFAIHPSTSRPAIETALSRAVTHNHTDLARMLLSLDVMKPILANRDFMRSVLAAAARKGATDMVFHILQLPGAPSISQALAPAAEAGQDGLVARLLEDHASHTAVSSAMARAASSGEAQVLKLLLPFKNDLSQRDMDEMLARAAEVSAAAVQVLLDAGAKSTPEALAAAIDSDDENTLAVILPGSQAKDLLAVFYKAAAAPFQSAKRCFDFFSSEMKVHAANTAIAKAVGYEQTQTVIMLAPFASAAQLAPCIYTLATQNNMPALHAVLEAAAIADVDMNRFSIKALRSDGMRDDAQGLLQSFIDAYSLSKAQPSAPSATIRTGSAPPPKI